MSLATSKTYQRLPDYLKSFVVEQNYSKYTAREQATWRFIMRQAREFFKAHAHPVYLDGLNKSGIPISRIPDVEDMDRVLGRFGWGAVCVCGFIPPLAFLDFQARKVLPIAADMRSLEHLAYTPAPDIVHEAAGHAPIIADADYADYLTSYAQLARKAIFSSEDIRLYEAIRTLSDVKENPDSTAEMIAAAEEQLSQAASQISWTSEASQVARMNWWTVEYGLIGPLDHPQIYGAGLLSSLGESRQCLTSQVKKIPLTLACTEQSYDITRPQPQLFVARSFAQLREILTELESTMAFKRGGLASLQLAQRAATVTSSVLDSGLVVSGILEELIQPAAGELEFLRWRGPVQLSFAGRQLADQGRKRHPHGFSSPFGAWAAAPQRNPAEFQDADLAAFGLQRGKQCRLAFQSGFVVEGVLKAWLRQTEEGGAERLLLLTWQQCTVKRGATMVFDPAWGEFDMGVGLRAASVYGGPGDWEAYGAYDLGHASSTPARSSPYTKGELGLFAVYERIRQLREARVTGSRASLAELQSLAGQVLAEFKDEWLLGVELAELLELGGGGKLSQYAWGRSLIEEVLNPAGAKDGAIASFITMGLSLAALPD